MSPEGCPEGCMHTVVNSYTYLCECRRAILIFTACVQDSLDEPLETKQSAKPRRRRRWVLYVLVIALADLPHFCNFIRTYMHPVGMCRYLRQRILCLTLQGQVRRGHLPPVLARLVSTLNPVLHCSTGKLACVFSYLMLRRPPCCGLVPQTRCLHGVTIVVGANALAKNDNSLSWSKF